MARSNVSYTRHRTTYRWPVTQFNAWIIFLLLTASVILGIFAQFIQIQGRLRLGVPWIFPYGITVGALTILMIMVLLIFSQRGKLTPEILMLISFVLLVLYITGIVGTGIQLFGNGRVSATCNANVNNNGVSGPSASTLAWLQQNTICSCWYAVFSFWIIGSIIFIWLFIFAIQVGQGAFD